MTVTVFFKGERLVGGTTQEVVPAVRALQPLERASDLLAFDDATGKQVDLDVRPEADAPPRPRGRPTLGVKAREVTLLPRHWDWLNTQRGGASGALRRLVEEASKRERSAEQCRDAAYRFLSVMAGDLPKFEDAVRELYGGNRIGYDHFTYGWPRDIRDHGRRLAFPE